MAQITSYAFGSMTIDGQVFQSDLIIFPDSRVQDNWYRRSGHTLAMADLNTVLQDLPDLIIAGTGAYGRMTLAHGLEKELAGRGIRITAMPTKEAAGLYTTAMAENKTGQRIAACFHLTC